MAASSLHQKLPADPAAAREARDAVRTRFSGVMSRATLEELLLAVSEMVSMVARNATEPTVDLRVTWQSQTVRLEVQDGPTEIQPELGGQVLTRLSSRWGIRSSPPAVWAEMTMH